MHTYVHVSYATWYVLLYTYLECGLGGWQEVEVVLRGSVASRLFLHQIEGLACECECECECVCVCVCVCACVCTVGNNRLSMVNSQSHSNGCGLWSKFAQKNDQC